MTELDKAKSNFENKLKQLLFTCSRTENVLNTGKATAVQRQLDALKALSSETETARRAYEALLIAQSKNDDEIFEWNTKVEADIGKADDDIKRVQEWQDELRQAKDNAAREEQFKFEIKMQESKLKLQTEHETQKSSTQTYEKEQEVSVKLPKLVISKYDGSYTDWTRFWGQFNESVEKSGLPSVAKFSYLKELLCDKVRRDVESLPFSSEGYNRARAILEEKYGKENEIVKAYSKKILELPLITSSNAKKISEFSDQLTYCVRSLESMKKLDGVNGLTSLTLDKLPGIRGDLVRQDSEWESWDLGKLEEALRLWVRRNPVDITGQDAEDQEKRKRDNKSKLFLSRQGRKCVYCEGDDHKANDCKKVTSVQERRQILAKKRLCFNCAVGAHRAAQCQSKTSCQKCEKRHHTSICEKSTTEEVKKVTLTPSGVGEGVFPAILLKVDGIITRALIDTGAGSSYVSAKVGGMLTKKPCDVSTKRVEMLMGSHQVRMETYMVEIQSLDDSFKMNTKMIKVNKNELLTIDNPHYEKVKANYPYLGRVNISDNDVKDQLPIHVILGVGDYAKIKTNSPPLIGEAGEPVAERTKLGWFIMSPGNEPDRQTMFLTQTSHVEFEELCRLDVLGLHDSAEGDQHIVHTEVKEQLWRSPEGWYETGLPWRGNHPHLPSNKVGSLRRLSSLTKRLHRDGNVENYDAVIRAQLQEGIVEQAPKSITGREFYIPHKGVVKETAETTKLRVVYDASAKADPSSPSLNDCLNPGPPLQNKLWDVLVQQRAFPVMVSGDIRQAFLQIRIKEAERDALRFHWRKDDNSELETLRFTRVLFGLAPSPYLLQAVLETHLDSWSGRLPDEVEHLRRSMYVDDLLSGGLTTKQAETRKEAAREILEDATFNLHKWSSNIPQLEADDRAQLSDMTGEQSYAKTQLKVEPQESKVLGLKWNKSSDTLKISFPIEDAPATKRGILSKLAKIYDPLGLVSPLALEGKLVFRDVCEAKTPWDAELHPAQLKRWKAWERSLPAEVELPRSIVGYQEQIEGVELHSFGDASLQGVGAAVYAVVKQTSGTTQQLVAAKSRLAKRNLSIPRLELVAAHMAKNLLVNVCSALPKELTPSMFAWLDSTVALHWICGNGTYKQFVANRVAKIKEHPTICWRHVPTENNPADLASRGGSVSFSDLWWSGPEWLQDPDKWPNNPVTQSSPEAIAEAKIIREVIATTKPTKMVSDEFDTLLERSTLRRTLRVGAWIKRFIHNCRNKVKRFGPLDTEETEAVRNWWIRRIQQRDMTENHFQETSARLGLRTDSCGILVCGGRIQGSQPIYLPREAQFTERLVQRVHCETLHGGVGLTMAALREKFWIPRLRSLVKMVRSRCWGCKKFRVKSYQIPVPGPLPQDRTTAGTAFEVIGVDFAGPIRYRKSTKSEGKAYLAIFACSLSRAVHLELLRNLETSSFIVCFKRFIARRGRPRVVYSDNGGTFIKARKWLELLRKDERLRGFVEEYEIKWKFNLSRAPWWGGQFERLIGVVKSAMYKVIGGGHLTWDELSEVLLDVEIQVNRRPLIYVEDDIEMPILTPSTFLQQRTSQLPEGEPWRIEAGEIRKRAKYLIECRNKLWRRWKREYLVALRERHNMTHKVSKFQPKLGDVVIIQSESKNRGMWPLAIVEETYPGKDNAIRAARLKTKNGSLERAIQHLYPLELNCDITEKEAKSTLDPKASEFKPRPKRDAAVAARLRTEQLAEAGQQELE